MMLARRELTKQDFMAYQRDVKLRRREWLEARHKKNPCCQYCGNVTKLHPRGYCSTIRQEPGQFHATLDHAIPRSQGGKDVPSNFRLSCWTCNFLKEDMSEADYRSLLAREGVL